MASAGLRRRINSSRNSAPLARRTTVKDAGSMAPSFSASRQNTELAAKATRLKSAGQTQARALRSASVVVPVLMVRSPLRSIVVIAAMLIGPAPIYNIVFI
ncbi:hypothetical protein D3C85_1646210 [compost metagenome]